MNNKAHVNYNMGLLHLQFTFCKAFDGTLILVSHDRDFLDGLAEKVFEFGNKRVKEHFEDIQGFLAKKKMENLREIEKKN